MDNEELILKAADLWFNQDYSSYDIAMELSIPADRASAITESLEKLSKIIKKGILERIRHELED